MTKDTGGPAFPESKQDFEPNICGGGYVLRSQNGGMTLRDWFAGQAVPSLVKMQTPSTLIGEMAYKFADAMLAERSKP